MLVSRYFYRVGDGVTFSQIYSFTSIAPKGKLGVLCAMQLSAKQTKEPLQCGSIY